MPDDRCIIVAVPVGVSQRGEIVTGSTKARCADCDAAVWVAPSSQIMMRRLPDEACKVLCLGCARVTIEADPEPEFTTTYEEAFKLLSGEADD